MLSLVARRSANHAMLVFASVLVGCSLVVPLDALDDGSGGAGTSATSGSPSTNSVGGASTTGPGGGVGGEGGQPDLSALYAAEVLTDQPIAYYRLDEEITPTFFDSGPNGYHGTYTGTVELSAPGILPGNTAVRMARLVREAGRQPAAPLHRRARADRHHAA